MPVTHGARVNPRGPAGLPLRRRWLAAGLTVLVAGAIAVGVLLANAVTPNRTAFVVRPQSGAPSQPATPSPTGPTGPTVSFAAVGDIIMGSTPRLPPNGGRTFFDDVKPELTGDVVMGNLETPLTADATSTKCRPTTSPTEPGAAPEATPSSKAADRCFAFRVPPSYAKWIREAGFTVVNIANNHMRDHGAKGLRDTRAALAAHGVQHTGAAGQITMLAVGGVRVAVLGFAPYSWTQSVVDIPAAAELVRRAAGGADLVVVNMHAGAEGADKTHVRPGTEMFLGENRGDPVAFAHAVVDAGADLVVGHSPHVMRGMEWYQDRLIAYSMGNFAGYRVLSSAGPLGIGGILKVALRADGSWVRGSLVPTRMANGGLPTLDPQRRAVALVDGLSRQDLGAAACRIASTGELQPPPR